jgi:hypothetical protein
MVFTPDQSRILATSGRRTNIVLSQCKLEDDGAEFLARSDAREDKELGPANLTIENHFLLDDRIFVSLMDRRKFQCLKLERVTLSSRECCRAMATCQVESVVELWQQLRLSFCGSQSVSFPEMEGPKW